MTTLLDTEIKFDRITRDYAVIVAGETVGYAANYREAEQIRTEAISEALYQTATALDALCPTCGGEGDCPDCDPRCATCGGDGDCPDCGTAAEYDPFAPLAA